MSMCDFAQAPTPLALEALVGLVARRLELGIEVAAVKFVSGIPVDDPAREQEILRSAAAQLRGAGLPDGVALRFLRDQIEAGKLIQRGLHAHWYSHPEQLPPARQGLAEGIRPELDAVNRRMLMLLARLEPVPRAYEDQLGSLLENAIAATQLRHLSELRRCAGRLALRALYEAPRDSRRGDRNA